MGRRSEEGGASAIEVVVEIYQKRQSRTPEKMIIFNTYIDIIFVKYHYIYNFF
jgi:hypothetical protein